MIMDTIHILLVEDDEDDRLIIQEYLAEIEENSYQLVWAKKCQGALDLISEKSFDIALIDYRIGPENGLDLLVEIKKDHPELPVILLTGSGDRKVDLAAMQIGAADFLMKGQIDARILERSIRYAIEHTCLIKTLNEISIHDQLTGLFNRREMDRLLEQELERVHRYGHPFSLIMIDIDHFKSVNDQYGHPIGDQVLRWLADIMKARVRKTDRCIRFGGEEFAIILPETKKENALIVAEWLRKKIAESPFWVKYPDGTQVEISITISLGIADAPGYAKDKDRLIQAADQALYQAKKNGRNQVVITELNTVQNLPLFR
jgi:diguanylate cyclase (GGDEF)-like protein